jgi:hypothetical protein
MSSALAAEVTAMLQRIRWISSDLVSYASLRDR